MTYIFGMSSTWQGVNTFTEMKLQFQMRLEFITENEELAQVQQQVLLCHRPYSAVHYSALQ